MDAATTAWMQEVGRRRMPKPRAAMGQGWPFAAGPRSKDGVREVERSETRMQGQAFLVTFWATAKSDSP